MDKKLLFIMKKEVIYLIFYHQLVIGKWQFLCLRNSGSSGSEGSIDAGMNGIIAETSVEKPEQIILELTNTSLDLDMIYLSWASGMTGVRGVAALFLDSIWSSIFPISFFRSLAAGSTVSQTLRSHIGVLSVSAKQGTALPGVKQLGLWLTGSTEVILTWK